MIARWVKVVMILSTSIGRADCASGLEAKEEYRDGRRSPRENGQATSPRTASPPLLEGSWEAFRRVASQPAVDRLIPWGSGSSQVGLRPQQTEQLGECVSAVAVGSSGRLYLLDRLNARVVSVTSDGLRTEAVVPRDAVDLAVGRDGSLAVYSPWRARVWLYAEGRRVGEMRVPRAIRMVRGIRLESSRRIRVHTAYQETFDLGSPSAPLALPAVLRSKQEGAYFLADGSGVAAQRQPDGRAEVLLLRGSAHARIAERYPVGEDTLAVRVIGVTGDVVCARVERTPAGPLLMVQRSVVCLRGDSGQVIFSRSLPEPGLYLPRRELVLGGAPVRLAFIHPASTGLRISSWVLSGLMERGDR